VKIQFENWIENSHFSVDAGHLLKNSVICYKAGAPTAALLMGYIGLLVSLKDRMMRGNKPNLYPQPTWETQLNLLQNEDKWEETIFSAVMQQEKINSAKVRVMDPVFVINDNLRAQIRYWKDRRNDCAHHKDNEITLAHVETFWSFLQSNLQKITLEGGKATLINKLEKHYNTTYTPTGEDVLPLVKEIKGAVEKSEMYNFWTEVIPVISDLYDYNNETEFLDTVLKLNDDELTESLIDFLKKDDHLLNAYINARPAILSRLGYDNQEIRSFWQIKLKKMTNPIAVYSSMLRNALIPEAEIKTANELVSTFYKYTTDREDHFVLAANGFGDILYHNLFVVHSPADFKYWHFMNQNSDLYTQYIEFYPLKDEVMKILSAELAKTSWNPQFLQNNINYLFKNNSDKKKEYIEKSTSLGLDLPEPITELFT